MNSINNLSSGVDTTNTATQNRSRLMSKVILEYKINLLHTLSLNTEKVIEAFINFKGNEEESYQALMSFKNEEIKLLQLIEENGRYELILDEILYKEKNGKRIGAISTMLGGSGYGLKDNTTGFRRLISKHVFGREYLELTKEAIINAFLNFKGQEDESYKELMIFQDRELKLLQLIKDAGEYKLILDEVLHKEKDGKRIQALGPVLEWEGGYIDTPTRFKKFISEKIFCKNYLEPTKEDIIEAFKNFKGDTEESYKAIMDLKYKELMKLQLIEENGKYKLTIDKEKKGKKIMAIGTILGGKGLNFQMNKVFKKFISNEVFNKHI